MSVKDIEVAIEHLSPDEVNGLTDWLVEYREQLWDRQIEEDARAGRLDHLINRAKQRISRGETKPL